MYKDKFHIQRKGDLNNSHSKEKDLLIIHMARIYTYIFFTFTKFYSMKLIYSFHMFKYEE